MNKAKIFLIMLLMPLTIWGCDQETKDGSQREVMKEWYEEADLSGKESADELYQAALEEETLVIYSVSSRVFESKESFEKEYPGLTVEVKDIRGDDLVNMLLDNYRQENYICDLVICSDCDGSLGKELLESEILYPYIPWDIVPKMKEGHADRELIFLGEALMLFYNEQIFQEQPIQNIWELTEEKYRGKIIMANPLSSFSTYGFCTTVMRESEAMAEAYESYTGEALVLVEGKTAGEVFWERAGDNILFTNSSDEVMEGIGGKGGSNDMWIGIMISSKMRYQELGYHFSPIYKLNPFAAVYTPNSVTIAGGARNVNAAKLFVRFLIGESDGAGEGLKPFSTAGTWSTRIDVKDADKVPLSEIDLVKMNRNYLYENRAEMRTWWKEFIKEKMTP